MINNSCLIVDRVLLYLLYHGNYGNGIASKAWGVSTQLSRVALQCTTM